MKPAWIGLSAVIFASSTVAETKLPPIEEAASRAAMQDQLGNICPGVMPDYAMRVILVGGFKAQSPERWASAYREATHEVVTMLSKPDEAKVICGAALELYGPKGSYVPNLLKPSAP